MYHACYLHDSIPENTRDAARKVGYKNRECLKDSTLEEGTRSWRVELKYRLAEEKHVAMSRYVVWIFIVAIFVREYSRFSANRYITNYITRRQKIEICRFLFLIPRSWFFSVYRYQGTIEGDGQGYKVRKGRRSERVWKIVRGNMQQPVLEFRTLPSDCKSSRIKLSGRRSKIKLTNKFQPCNWEITRDCRCRHGTVRNEKTKACIPFSKCPNVL